MNTTPEEYLKAQKSQDLEVKQHYLDKILSPKLKSIEHIVMHTEKGEALENYADVLISMKYLSSENRGKLIKESHKALEDIPILIIATPWLIGDQFPLRLLCAPRAFDAPTEAHFLSKLVDNYVFMATQLYEGFTLPDNRVVNSESSNAMPREMLTDYLRFLGYRNQAFELPRRQIDDDKYCTEVEIELRKSLMTVMNYFERQAHELRLSIHKRSK